MVKDEEDYDKLLHGYRFWIYRIKNI